MNSYFILLSVLLPFIGSIVLLAKPFKQNKMARQVYTFVLVLVNTIIVYMLLLNRPEEAITLFKFTGNLAVVLKIDGLSCIFAGIISTLWPLATLYGFEYMEHEKYGNVFFMFYTMTYGVTAGIAFAGNLLTLYFFYELLTLVTVPLVMITLTRDAIRASRKYLYYSLGGAAFAFIGLIFIMTYAGTTDFQFGGLLSSFHGNENILYFIYVLAFCGFGVKAALFPFSGWLPTASVAPTPVTALLHAVAVVKAGSFAIIRLTYYCYGVDFLRGSWAQYTVMTITLITILYGSSMALKERHIKRRLAYSTISNLSYILFGVTIMTPLGLCGALLHMVFHAFTKIEAFFAVGAIMHKAKKDYVFEMNGLAKRMPVTFFAFTVSAFSLVGVPLLPVFISKWYLAKSAFETTAIFPKVGVLVLAFSAFLTAIYMLSFAIRAIFVPQKDGESRENCDPGICMKLPFILLVIGMFVLGIHAQPLIHFISNVVGL